MIVPSIDLMGGQAVQLIGGERLEIEAGDPVPLMRRFRVAGPVAVIDLDAALGQGSNADLVEQLVEEGRCRVGGGIRTVDDAIRRLDSGAEQVILGTAADPETLRVLPRERVIAALDARGGQVVVEGWRTNTGRSVIERIAELRDLVGGFLVTFVEREGRMEGIDLDAVRAVVEAAAPVRVTVAGGVTTAEEVGAIHRLGADCQVGMALYAGRLDLGDAIAACVAGDPPWPTVVVDERGIALGFLFSTLESIRAAVAEGRGVYFSRGRGLWRKGETSGDTQKLIGIDLDCDSDCLRFVVRPERGGHCHLGTWTCWGEAGGVRHLERTLRNRMSEAPIGSYTRRLLDDPALLHAKLREEAAELAEAIDPAQVKEEAADMLYFMMVKLIASGKGFDEVERALDRRALRVTRRPGDAKS
jgi:phosphoribosyl-ATP pyrophosphohydrolase